MLKLQSDWRFNSPGPLAIEVINEFDDLVHKVASQGQQWGMLEHFKSYFAWAAGFTASTSSSESWAASDLHRSEEHTSELQSLMRISYAVFCLKKKTNTQNLHHTTTKTQKKPN